MPDVIQKLCPVCLEFVCECKAEPEPVATPAIDTFDEQIERRGNTLYMKLTEEQRLSVGDKISINWTATYTCSIDRVVALDIRGVELCVNDIPAVNVVAGDTLTVDWNINPERP